MSSNLRDRIHFGAGVLGAHRHLSVFINCPYDEEYRPIFDAVVFATVCCGFLPRCAIETGCIATPRMDRITQAILSSKYAIHDLCRCRGEGDSNLARFNMPVELGVSMAQRWSDVVLQAMGVARDSSLALPVPVTAADRVSHAPD